jgi:hypothetical protein
VTSTSLHKASRRCKRGLARFVVLPLRAALRLAVLGALFLAGSACEREVAPRVEPVSMSLLEPGRLGEALNSLLSPLPSPVRILTVKALHQQVIVQVQDAADPARVAEYRFRDGRATGPSAVTLLGQGKLQDNLFPLQAASPQVAAEVVRTVNAEYQAQGLRIRKLVMIRNLPRSRDIQFKVFLDGPDGVLLVKADKSGRLLGPPEPAPESFN